MRSFLALSLLLYFGAMLGELAFRWRQPVTPGVFEPQARAPRRFSSREVSDVLPLEDGRLLAVSQNRSIVLLGSDGSVASDFRFREHGLPTGRIVRRSDFRQLLLSDPANNRLLIFPDSLDGAVREARTRATPIVVVVNGGRVGCLESDGTLEIFEGRDLLPIGRFRLPGRGNAAVSTGDRLLIAVPAERALIEVDLASGRVVRKLTLAGRPSEIALSPDGRRAYVADRWSPVVFAVNSETLALKNTIVLPSPAFDVAVSENGTLWAALGRQAAVAGIDPVSGRISETFVTGGAPNRVATFGPWVYTVAENGGQLERFADVSASTRSSTQK